MLTNAEAVSKVVNSLRFLNKDNRVSKRYILRLLRDSSKNLIAQKLLDRSISDEMNLYSKIECFEFEKVNVKDCPIVQFRLCRELYKSKCPLPELVFSRNGASIKEVTSVDALTEIYPTTPEQYRRDRKRKYYSSEDAYFYVDVDNHVYIVDKPIYAIDITILTIKTDEIKDCSACSDKNDCKNAWNENFVVPDKLADAVFRNVLQILSSTYVVKKVDENPNNVEGI